MSSMRSASSSTSTLTVSSETQPAVDEILQAARRRDDHVRVLRLVGLRLQRHAAVDGRDLDVGRRRSARTPRSPARRARASARARARTACSSASSALDDRDRERERLAGAGRALREDVAAAQRLRDDERSGSGTGRRCRVRRALRTRPRTPRGNENLSLVSTPSDVEIVCPKKETRSHGNAAHPHSVETTVAALGGSRVIVRSSSRRRRCSSCATRSSSSSHSSRVTRPSSRASPAAAPRALPHAHRVAAPARGDVVERASAARRAAGRAAQRAARARRARRGAATGLVPWGRVLRRWRRRSRFASRRRRRADDVLDDVERRLRRRLGGGGRLGLARARGSPTEPSIDVAVLAACVLRLALLPAGKSGAAMKIDEYAPEVTPTSSANAKSLQRRAAEEEQRADRQQRDERRRQRAADRLPERDVDDRRERRAPHDRHVLADAVEDDDRVVDRVTEHGQDRGDRRLGHLAPGERVDADGDQDVVEQRGDHRHGEREALKRTVM